MSDKQLFLVLCWATAMSAFSQSSLVDIDLEISLLNGNSTVGTVQYFGLTTSSSTDVGSIELHTSTEVMLPEE